MFASYAGVAHVPLVDPTSLPPLTEKDVAPAVRQVTPAELNHATDLRHHVCSSVDVFGAHAEC
jgi:hypothetical protein